MPPEQKDSPPVYDSRRHARLKRAKGVAAREFLLIVALAAAAAVAMVVMGGPTAGGDPLSAITHSRY